MKWWNWMPSSFECWILSQLHHSPLIGRFFSSSSLSAIRCHLHIWGYLIFLPAILIPACASPSPAFLMVYSAYKLCKQVTVYSPDVCLSQFWAWHQETVWGCNCCFIALNNNTTISFLSPFPQPQSIQWHFSVWASEQIRMPSFKTGRPANTSIWARSLSSFTLPAYL